MKNRINRYDAAPDGRIKEEEHGQEVFKVKKGEEKERNLPSAYLTVR